MKSQLLQILCFILFSINTFAQFGNGMGGRNNGRMNQQQNDMPTSKPIEKSADEIVHEMMPELTSELQLDGLQEYAVKQILVESVKRKGVVMKKESNEEVKYKEIQDINENANKDIEALLNPEQKEKFKVYKLEKNNPKQGRKYKKEKKSKRKN